MGLDVAARKSSRRGRGEIGVRERRWRWVHQRFGESASDFAIEAPPVVVAAPDADVDK